MKFDMKQMSGNNVGRVMQIELNVFYQQKLFMDFVLVTLFKRNFSAVCIHYVKKTRTEQMKYVDYSESNASYLFPWKLQ